MVGNIQKKNHNNNYNLIVGLDSRVCTTSAHRCWTRMRQLHLQTTTNPFTSWVYATMQFSINVGKQRDGGHCAKVDMNIHSIDTWYIALWSSTSARMSAIILPAAPTIRHHHHHHHHLLPEVLSHAITYIRNIQSDDLNFSHILQEHFMQYHQE